MGDVNVFIPNFSMDESGEDMCCCKTTDTIQCESPFLGKYQYGKDAMAGGGGGKWGVNRYTLYTPYSMSKIQNFFEGKAIWDPTSWSGFRKYNPSSREMEEFVNPNKGKVPRLFRVPVTTIVGYYDPELKMDNKDYIFPALHGAFGFVYNDDVAKSSTNGCELRVQTNNAGTRVFKLLTKRETSDTMNKFHVNIAAEEMASAAEVYCYGQQLVSKQLEGPKEDLNSLYMEFPLMLQHQNQHLHQLLLLQNHLQIRLHLYQLLLLQNHLQIRLQLLSPVVIIMLQVALNVLKVTEPPGVTVNAHGLIINVKHSL